MKRRRLSDLYVRGTEVSCTDGQGEPVVVWLQKLNDIDQQSVFRKASAARATQLTYRNNKESDEYKSVYGEVVDFANRETLIELVIREDLALRRMSVEAELSAEDEWNEDQYLQGLYDGWNDGLKDEYARDKEDPEAKRVFDELKRYTEAVDKIMDGERLAMIKDYENADETNLLEKVVEHFIKQAAGSAFMAEYEAYELFYAVRQPEDHKKKYFESRDEIDSISPEIKTQLLSAYQELVVEPTEGKDSEETPVSLPSSDAQEQQETGVSSGLMAVAQ